MSGKSSTPRAMQRASDHARALHERLMENTRALQPLLRRNAEQTERERRIPDDSIAALRDAGLFRMMSPKRFGGHEVGARTCLDVIALIAEACGSTAWVLGLLSNAAWFAGLLSDRAREEIFGADPDVRVTGVFAPSETMRRVEGGLRVSGKWYWASGSLHADWAMLGVLERAADGRVADRYLGFVPMRELSVENTWYASGMKGTGSNCLVAEDVFIPGHRMMSMIQAVEGKHPTSHNDEPLYRSACMPLMTLFLVAPQLGLAREALRYVIEMAGRRNIPYTIYERQADSPAFQLQIAEAAMKIDTAHLHAYRTADDIDGAAVHNERLDFKTRARARADAGYAARLVTEAINTLLSAYGAGAFADASPLQRIWRDANTAARHALVLPPVCEELYGKALLGLDMNITPLI